MPLGFFFAECGPIRFEKPLQNRYSYCPAPFLRGGFPFQNRRWCIFGQQNTGWGATVPAQTLAPSPPYLPWRASACRVEGITATDCAAPSTPSHPPGWRSSSDRQARRLAQPSQALPPESGPQSSKPTTRGRGRSGNQSSRAPIFLSAARAPPLPFSLDILGRSRSAGKPPLPRLPICPWLPFSLSYLKNREGLEPSGTLTASDLPHLLLRREGAAEGPATTPTPSPLPSPPSGSGFPSPPS
jgi:hypothetical protein